MISLWQKITFLFIVFYTTTIKSQLSGTFSVPATYTSIAAAISDLNTQGVNGPVTILINAGYTETAPNGGYTLTATGTALNPITFKRNGSGANPIVNAPSFLTAGTPSTAVQDGIWAFVGCDYVTIDGIDLNDAGGTNPLTMEYGYGFFKASPTDGCQYNTIKNCTISMSYFNNDQGYGVAADGSRGIDMVNAYKYLHPLAVTITSPSGSNSFNKFYGNTFKNCNTCISVVGFQDSSPFNNADYGNEIGGTLPGTGNSFINYGGGVSYPGGFYTVNPATAIYTYGQYDLKIQNNVINNNNGSGIFHNGILRGIYTNSATAANASVLSNTLSFNTSTLSWQVIGIENASGTNGLTNTVSINNNVFASGTSSLMGVYFGIDNSGGPAFLELSGNTFTNNIINTPLSGGFIHLLRTSGAVSKLANITNNKFSYSTTTTFNSNGSFACLENNISSPTATTVIGNNVFDNFSFTGSGNNTWFNLISSGGIQDNVTISNNQASGLNINNYGNFSFITDGTQILSALSVNNNTLSNINFTGGVPFFGSCYFKTASSSPASSKQNFTGNLFSTITATTSGGASSLNFYGFYSTDGNVSSYPLKTVNSNTISNINILAGGNFYGYNLSGAGDGNGVASSEVYGNRLDNINFNGNVYGIYTNTVTSPAFPLKIYSNTFSNISTGGVSALAYGAYIGTNGAGASFYKNKIHTVTAGGISGASCGLQIAGTSTINIHNNLVGNITAPASSLSLAVYGINVTGAGYQANINYNTVYLNASSTGANFGSTALFANITASLTLRNNIFINNSTSNGSGLTVAFRRNTTSLVNFSSSSNNNLYYAGSPSANKLIFHDGTSSYQTLSSYKTLVSPRDGAAVTENVNFASTVGSNANYLNINTSVPTLVEGGAAPISITDDYSGTLRNLSTPDIGAWEGNFISTVDVVPPALLSSGFTTPSCLLSGRTLTANISDVTGVAGAALSPRIYYKINGGAYTSVAGSLTTGTSMNGVWTFNLTYVASSLDVISWFMVAQDAAATPNVFVSPSAGSAVTSVTNVTTPPVSPNTYTVSNLNGVYTVGSTGTFTSLTQAANIYNISCLSGPVTFSLIDANYSVNETFPITFLNNPDASATNSLLIIPAASLTSNVNGSGAAEATLKFLDARFIRINGVNGAGSSLSFLSQNTGTAAVIWLASSGGVGAGNKNLDVLNTKISSASNSAFNFGLLSSANASSVSVAGGADNDNITVQGNTITSVFYGILANGTSTASTGGLNNWVISSNSIGPVTSGTADIGYQGIHLENMISLSVSSNTVQNISCPLTNSICGIAVGAGVSNATVSLNKINSVKYTGSSSWGCIGMDIDPISLAASINVNNNMISDIQGLGGFAFNAGSIVGLRVGVSGTCGGINIYNNSIALNQGTSILGALSFFPNYSAAVYFGAGVTAIDFKDNILYSDVEFGISGSETYAIFSAVGPGAFTGMDYNNYVVAGTQGVIGKVAGVLQYNLANLQTSLGQNLNSLNVTPVFTSLTDLHLNPASNFFLDNFGIPISSIIQDIDGQLRSLTTPDMGADEFTSLPCTGANSGIISSSAYTLCGGQFITLSNTGASVGSGISYQWMVSASPGGPYSNVTGGMGATTLTYSTAPLNSGVYYYVFQTTCSPASVTNASNELTVTVNAIPTASVMSNSPVCSGNTLNLSGSSNIATNYLWIGPGGFTSSLQNPVINNVGVNANGAYTLIASANSCSSIPAVLPVVIDMSPTSINVTPNFTTFCGSANQTLTATGGLVPAPLNFGTASTTNAGGNYPAPYNAAFGGQRMQMLILASELSAAGFVANTPLTSIEFPVVSLGSNWGNSTFDCQAFQVNIGLTSLGSLSSFQSGLTNVIAPVNFTPSTGFNPHYFSSSFLWDGVSNVIIETSFSNNNTGTIADAVTQYTTTNPGSITFNSTIVYYANNQTAASMATAPSINALYTARPDFKLNGLVIGNYSWSPSTGLSAATGASVASTTSSTTNYTINVNNAACTSSAVVTISVNPQPIVNVSVQSVTACAGAATTATASGASTYSWSNGATTAYVSVAPVSTTVYTVTGTSLGCTDTATVNVTVNALPAVNLTASSNTTCINGNTISLSGTPSGGNYSGTGVSSNIFTPSAIQGTYTPSYTYTDAVTGCTNVATVSISVNLCTGVNNYNIDSDTRIYPNPNAGIFEIEFTGSNILREIELSDLSGRLLMKQTSETSSNWVNISEYSNGIYILKIKTKGAVKVVKIIKE